MGRRLALLIATYRYDDKSLHRLTSPAHDAEALAMVLKNPAIAGFEVTTLVNESRQHIGEAISRLYRDRVRDDLTLLYFTGHGLKDDEGRLFLATRDTRRDSLRFTSLPAEDIDREMSAGASHRQVLILDCCYGGAFPSGRAKGDERVDFDRLKGHGRVVLTASGRTQYALEGDNVKGRATQSVFTRHLVEGLRDGSADLDGDGDITLDEVYDYVNARVIAENPKQQPAKMADVQGHILIARNTHWAVPARMQRDINSGVPEYRIAVLNDLIDLYQRGNDHVRARVLDAVRHLAADPDPEVAAAALVRLRQLSPGEELPSRWPAAGEASPPAPHQARDYQRLLRPGRLRYWIPAAAVVMAAIAVSAAILPHGPNPVPTPTPTATATSSTRHTPSPALTSSAAPIPTTPAPSSSNPQPSGPADGVEVAKEMGFLGYGQQPASGVGCVITSVKPGSQVAKLGLIHGDVITLLLDIQVSDCSEMIEILGKYPGVEASMAYMDGETKRQTLPFIIPLPGA